jgi:hypothetical protein
LEEGILFAPDIARRNLGEPLLMPTLPAEIMVKAYKRKGSGVFYADVYPDAVRDLLLVYYAKNEDLCARVIRAFDSLITEDMLSYKP